MVGPALPTVGLPHEQVMARLRAARAHDVSWRDGRLHGSVYWAGDDVTAVAQDAYREFYFENAMAEKAFPSMAEFRQDIVSFTANLLHAPGPFGVTTTGGTESNLMAVWTAICRAKDRAPRGSLEIVLPYSSHPSLVKAARYFGIREIRVPSTADFAADADAVRRAITPNTILIVGSAPAYSHGVIDPIEELGAIAVEHGVPLHVDSCVGGLILPFIERLGRPVPAFDFRVPGVSSMSADVHKHGYAPKGLSVLLHRDPDAVELAATEFRDWPNGRYGTPGMAGTRSGAVVAGAWAVMNFLGEDGYLRVTDRVMQLTDRLLAGISAIEPLYVVGDPPSNKFAYAARDLDMAAVADGLEKRGWFVGFQSDPPAVNMHIQLFHEAAVERYLADLGEVVDKVRLAGTTSDGREAAYN